MNYFGKLVGISSRESNIETSVPLNRNKQPTKKAESQKTLEASNPSDQRHPRTSTFSTQFTQVE